MFAIDPTLSGCISRASDISLLFFPLFVATTVEVVPWRQYFARMIGQKAASSGLGEWKRQAGACRAKRIRGRADAHSAASRPDTIGLVYGENNGSKPMDRFNRVPPFFFPRRRGRSGYLFHFPLLHPHIASLSSPPAFLSVYAKKAKIAI